MVTPEDEKTEEQKLNEDVAALKTKIKNTEYDLAHMFRGNDIIEQKLHNTKELLAEKENNLTKLLGGDIKKEEKFHKMEDQLTEKDTTAASEEQEKMLDEEIEKEFM